MSFCRFRGAQACPLTAVIRSEEYWGCSIPIAADTVEEVLLVAVATTVA
jgi:hypothetical protein